MRLTTAMNYVQDQDGKAMGVHDIVQEMKARSTTMMNYVQDQDWKAMGHKIVQEMKARSTTMMIYVQDQDWKATGHKIVQEMKARSTTMMNYFQNQDWKAMGVPNSNVQEMKLRSTAMMNYVQDAHKSLLGQGNSAGYLVRSFDEIFPPGTRADQISHWFHLAKPYLIAAAVVYLLFKWFGGRGAAGKMMKAPGRNFRMPRARFEANPRAYFRDLHRD